MGLENRPYIGSWKLGSKKLVQYTPDALVYINGDLALPGCQKCNSRIDIQKYLTEVSVDAGCDPGAASASFTLSVPQHSADSISRDAQFLFRAGLEVHIYMRGYFPVKGLYSHLDNPVQRSRTVESQPAPEESKSVSKPVTTPSSVSKAFDRMGLSAEKRAMADKIYAEFSKDGYTPAMGVAAVVQAKFESGLVPSAVNPGRTPGAIKANAYKGGVAFGLFQLNSNSNAIGTSNKGFLDGKVASTAALAEQYPDKYYNAQDPDINIRRVKQAARIYGFAKNSKLSPAQTFDKFFHSGLGYGRHGDSTKRDAYGRSIFGAAWDDPDFNKKVRANQSLTPAAPTPAQQASAPALGTESPKAVQEQAQESSPSYLEEMGLGGQDIENVLAYPYYHVFHGVVTQATHSYSGGTNTVSVQCVSMLHFWQYHQMSTNASIFGPRASNSGLRSSLKGNNFTGRHPYEIIYALHNDTAGAAGGVAWAISQKTNQTAKSSLSGENLFSLNIKYWQKRFNTRDIKLRMHGATGELFNAAQAAFLSKLSSTQLTALLRGRFGGSTGVTAEILSQAVAVGFGNKRKLEALLFAKKTQGAESKGKVPTFELEMPEMIAFVSDIAQWGQVQLFESSYESKLDIANKVCEVTGFEFFQDVDGDFVFKPPMYNLDTSSSRIYRVEDIDIININFDDKEPQVTYMVCKGSQFSNIKGTGTENEWGVQGQYIDYRLVAQFGWRPGNFETAYLTDPKSMFFAAVNRLDVMNAPTKSATCTIPLRPELRPGYPVYVPYLDCFYYCNSFAHSFSVGGSCTTSLQLIAKRAKFFAPGEVKQTGIEAIHLDYTALPEKPLQVVDEAGRPKLSGFPNVVMALDPEQIDPMFFIVGTDVENVDNPETLEGLLKMAVELKIVRDVTGTTENPGPYYEMSLDDNTSATFYFKTDKSKTNVKTPAKVEFDLRKAASLYVSEKKKLAGQLAKQEPAAKKALAELASLEKERVNTNDNTPAGAKKAQALDKKILAARKKADTLTTAYDKKLNALNDGLASHKDLAVFIKLIRTVSEKFVGGKQFSSRYGSNPASSITLLDMLSDRKAVFTNGSLPGSYRYFSASHPDPLQQGMKHLTLNIRRDKSATGGKHKVLSESYLEPIWQQQKVPTYVPSGQITTPQGGTRPESQFQLRTPQRGIKVLTSRPNAPHGEVVPTSEIRELMFASHMMLGSKKKSVKNRGVVKADTVGLTLQRALENSAAKAVGDPTPTMSLTQALEAWRAELTDNLKTCVVATRGANTAWTTDIPEFPAVAAPGVIIYQGGFISTSVPMNTYKFEGDTDPTKEEAFPDSSNRPLRTFWADAAREYASVTYANLLTALGEWQRMLDVNMPGPDIESWGQVQVFETKSIESWGQIQVFGPRVPDIVSGFLEALKGVYGVTAQSAQGKSSAKEVNTTVYIYSPVFPISDAKGYQVVGSYRYGRDVDIDPEGVFDVLHKQDPLSMLDKNLIDDVLTAFVKKQPIYVDQPTGKTAANGSPITKRVQRSGPVAESDVERRALAVWRKNWSDQDIIDMGLAKRNGNLLQVDLSNWIADKGKDGIQKLPVANAAFSLADLAPHTSREFCSCKAAEADVLLDVAGQQNFIQFSQRSPTTHEGSGESQEDATIQWIKATTASAAIPWIQSQAALRGSGNTQPQSSLIQTTLGLADRFQQVSNDLDAKKAAFQQSVDNLQRLREGQDQ